ncbi:2-amino-5-chloromuconic acid deaminase [compost metagenome]
MKPDPVAGLGLAGYARALREGRISAASAVRAYLQRIDALEPSLHAFEHIASEAAMAAASAIDGLLAAGTDLGPLMGVPIAVKDVLHVEGMPTRAGSDVDVSDLVDTEGEFVRMLRRAGCIILGKTQTVEFAIGSTGTNYRRGTPRNPCDPTVFRLPAGSSSGSAVAVAAGLCAFAVGTDTGGSVRGPAAFCGVFGLKFGRDSASRNGVFPMSRSFDSLGLLTASAADAILAWEALGGKYQAAKPARGLRLGRPRQYFFDGLAPEVASCTQRALETLAKAGAEIVEVDVPELEESDELYTAIARPELMASLGSSRFRLVRAQLNPDVAERIAEGLDSGAEAYLRASWRLQRLARRARRGFDGLDAWVGPVKQHLPPAFAGRFESLSAERDLARLCAGPTRVANVFGLCASSQPIQRWGASLPVGLQLLRPAGDESRLLAVALACEQVLGRREPPDMRAYLR